MRLSVGLVVIISGTIAGVLEVVVTVLTVVARLIALRVVLIHWPPSRLVDPTVVVGHSRVGPVEFLETARVLISGQHTVMSSTYSKNNNPEISSNAH